MNYMELLFAYNALKSKLLIKSFFEKNLDKISEIDLKTMFMDFRFYNPNISFKENKKIKLDLAKKINYNGIMCFGDLIKNLLYKREVILDKKYISYYPYLLERRDNNFIYNYEFLPDKYIQTIKHKAKILLKLEKKYITLSERFAKFYNSVSYIPAYVNMIEYSNDNTIFLFITNKDFKEYITVILKNYDFNTLELENGVKVW